MSICCTSKAIILRDGCVLLNRCRRPDGGLYYDLPGGGQHLYETMEDALIREVREETGYIVKIARFAGIAEEIYTSQELRETYPEYTHRIFHLFAAEVTEKEKVKVVEKDLQMEESVWVTLEKAETLNINPFGTADALRRIAESNETVYFGTRTLEKPE